MTSWRRLSRCLPLVVSSVAVTHVRALPAQTIAAQITAVDTVATASEMTGSASTFVVAFQVNVASCARSGSTNCHAYMWAVPTGTAATNLRWSTTSSVCASGRAISTANPAADRNTADRLLLVTAPSGTNPATSGVVTAYVCHDATLNWSTAPFRLPYSLNFVVTRW